MNFGDPSTFGTEMADRFVASGANLPPPVSNRVKKSLHSKCTWADLQTLVVSNFKKVKYRVNFDYVDAKTNQF